MCLRGHVVEEFYVELERIYTESIVLTPNGPNVEVNIPARQWRSIHAVESGSVELSCKDGKCDPLGDEDILKSVFFVFAKL